MIKYLMLIGMIYMAYRLFTPKTLDTEYKEKIDKDDKTGFTDYEEIE